MQIVWEGNWLAPNGHATVCRNMVRALAKRGLDVRLESPIEDDIQQFPDFVDGDLLAMANRPAADPDHTIRIIHRVPTEFERRGERLTIGMTYTEATSMSPEWIDAVNTQVDALILPSQQASEVAKKAGVARSVWVVPQGVDVHTFRPRKEYEPDPFDWPQFRFLSVFEWVPRKGYDVLLKAYWDEFCNRDDVCLVIKTRYFGQGSVPGGAQSALEELQYLYHLYQQSTGGAVGRAAVKKSSRAAGRKQGMATGKRLGRKAAKRGGKRLGRTGVTRGGKNVGKIAGRTGGRNAGKIAGQPARGGKARGGTGVKRTGKVAERTGVKRDGKVVGRTGAKRAGNTEGGTGVKRDGKRLGRNAVKYAGCVIGRQEIKKAGSVIGLPAVKNTGKAVGRAAIRVAGHAVDRSAAGNVAAIGGRMVSGSSGRQGNRPGLKKTRGNATTRHQAPKAQHTGIKRPTIHHGPLLPASPFVRFAPDNKAPIYLYEGTLSDAKLAELYRFCSAFVLPTHGEGIGLPLLEAAATGLPLVVTGWGGQMDFIQAEEAYIVDYTLAEVPKELQRTWPSLYGGAWANPSIASLRGQMRYLYGSRSGVSPKAVRQQQHVITHWNWDSCAAHLIAHLEGALGQKL